MTRVARNWRIRWAIAVTTAALFVAPAYAFREAEMQDRYCADLPINQHLPDGSEVDCIFEDMAIEVDFSDHWAQAIGQSLHYARILGTRPAVILVCNEGVRAQTCDNHLERMVETLIYWRIGMFIWDCESARDMTRTDCDFIDIYDEMQ